MATELELENAVLQSFKNDRLLCALCITNCNADKPVPFNRAYVSYKTCSYPTVAFFGSGFVKIAQAVSGQNTFRKGAFEKLQSFLRDTEHLECLKCLLSKDSKSEESIRNTLAVHYFQPLICDSQCVIEKGSSNICEHCRKTLNVGDTSLGHSSVWHGTADIVVKSSVIKVTKYPKNRDDDIDMDDNLVSEEDTEMEPSDDYDFDDIECEECWSLKQALALAIVNGFCERKKEASHHKKFIPSFLATEQTVRIIWYNTELDILLLSEKMSIWSSESRSWNSAKLNIDTLLHVWLALNFDNYDFDLKDEILKNTIHFNFEKVVGEQAFSIYVKDVAKPFEPFRIASIPEIESVEQPDESCFLFAKVKECYFQETKKFFSLAG